MSKKGGKGMKELRKAIERKMEFCNMVTKKTSYNEMIHRKQYHELKGMQLATWALGINLKFSMDAEEMMFIQKFEIEKN